VNDSLRFGLYLPPARPFDIAVRGNASPAWQEDIEVDLAGLAEAGMTWWLESLIHLDPLATERACNSTRGGGADGTFHGRVRGDQAWFATGRARCPN
jgi:hypothetical protein